MHGLDSILVTDIQFSNTPCKQLFHYSQLFSFASSRIERVGRMGTNDVRERDGKGAHTYDVCIGWRKGVPKVE